MRTSVTDLNEGDWIQWGTQKMRVVDVTRSRFDQIKLGLDYGNGGEPSTSFFDTDEFVLVVAGD